MIIPTTISNIKKASVRYLKRLFNYNEAKQADITYLNIMLKQIGYHLTIVEDKQLKNELLLLTSELQIVKFIIESKLLKGE